jgi:hypothetical protein
MKTSYTYAEFSLYHPYYSRVTDKNRITLILSSMDTYTTPLYVNMHWVRAGGKKFSLY